MWGGVEGVGEDEKAKNIHIDLQFFSSFEPTVSGPWTNRINVFDLG